MKKRPVGKFLRFLHGLSVFLCNIHKQNGKSLVEYPLPFLNVKCFHSK